MNSEIARLLRPNIAGLAPYHCARDEFQGVPRVALDANESPYDDGRHLNRYPDPLQRALKERIATLKGVRPEQTLLGNGSDEVIDLLYRAFCRPAQDAAVAIAPTYGMYQVLADINDVRYVPVPLRDAEHLDTPALTKAANDNHAKLLWLCSPNNPTGNCLDQAAMRELVETFDGITVVDEAYADFAGGSRWLTELDRHPRLVVMQTFSKAWGMAGARCGMAFAHPDLIAVLNNVKYPYNINSLTQRAVLEGLDHEDDMRKHVATTVRLREWLRAELTKLPATKRVWPSDANFLLARIDNAEQLYHSLVEQGIITRNRCHVSLIEGSLRITIGTEDETHELAQRIGELTR